MSTPRLWIGMGTGRCGTASLARLLDAQPAASVTHEAPRVLPWSVDRPALTARVAALRGRGGNFVGDVALSYLPYAELLLEEHPDARLLVLRRDREQTVRSYMRLAGGRNHFVRRGAGEWRADPEWDRCYPDYDEPDLEIALTRFWNDYYQRAEALAARHPERVLMADVPAALSSGGGVRRVLSHVGVPVAEQVTRVDVHENRGPSAAGRAKRAIAHRLRWPKRGGSEA